MNSPLSDSDTVIDYITGLEKPNSGSEGNRQRLERVLVEKLGYDRAAVEVDAPIQLVVDGEPYASVVDLVISVNNLRYMAIKCAAGSLASREREIISAARLMERYQIPVSIASDGANALVWDTVTGMLLGTGLAAIPDAEQARIHFDPENVVPLDEQRRHRQMLIYRSYDAMNIHR